MREKQKECSCLLSGVYLTSLSLLHLFLRVSVCINRKWNENYLYHSLLSAMLLFKYISREINEYKTCVSRVQRHKRAAGSIAESLEHLSCQFLVSTNKSSQKEGLSG